MQRMADRVAGYFVVGVVAIALLTFFAWGLFGPEPSWVYGLINAVAVLIIACPCALGLATPMSIMVATGKAATQGVLFRDAAAIENLRKVDTLIVDKTGTLTEGKPAFDRAVAAPGLSEDEVLRLAASLDQGSEHPLAAAIVRAARERGLALDKPETLRVEHAASVCAAGVAGRRDRARQHGADAAARRRGRRLASQAEALRAEGASVMYLAVDGRSAGCSPCPTRSRRARRRRWPRSRALGLRIVMATGDGLTTARAVAGRLGIDEVHGEVKPADKLALVEHAAERRPRRGDGRRRHQRRAGARQGRRRHRHGHRHRRGDEQRPGHARQGRPARHRARARAVRGDGRQHEAEPRLRLRLQRARRAAGRRRALSVHRLAAVADDRRAGDEPELGVRHHERAASARGTDTLTPATFLYLGLTGVMGPLNPP